MRKIDDKLISKAIDGDPRAFEVIYNQTYSTAKGIALSIVHNEHDAEDLIQDSYVKLLKNLPQLINCSRFQSYFNKIVANTCKDYQKKKKPNLFCEFALDDETYDDFEANLATPNKGDYIPEEIAKKAVSKRIIKAINKLPEEQRTCVMLHYYCEMTVDEIANMYGISRNTVLSRLSYSRKKLKKELQKDKNDKFFGIMLFPFVQQGLDKSQRILPFNFRRRVCFKKTIDIASKLNLLKVSGAYKAMVGLSAIPFMVQVGAVATVILIVAVTPKGIDYIQNQNKKAVSNTQSESITTAYNDENVHLSISQGKDYIIYKDDIITCNNNAVLFVKSGNTIYNGNVDDYVILDDDLYFVSNKKLVKYDLINQKVSGETKINATNICYTSQMTCVNKNDGTLTFVDEHGKAESSFNSNIKNAKFIDNKLYNYDGSNNLVKYDILSKTKSIVFYGKDNYGMNFAYQIKDEFCYYPNFDSDETALLNKSDGSVIKLDRPFVDFGVSDSYIYYSGCDDGFFRTDLNGNGEKKIYSKPLAFAGESNGYSAWYDIESSKTIIINDSSDTFDYFVPEKIDSLSVYNNYIFYKSGEEHFCKTIDELQKFNG